MANTTTTYNYDFFKEIEQCMQKAEDQKKALEKISQAFNNKLTTKKTNLKNNLKK